MLNFDKQVSQIGGWLTEEEGKFLYEIAKGAPKDGKIIEIGSWKGRSTVCLGQGSKDGNNAKIYAIDPHTGSSEQQKEYGRVNTYQEFLKNISNAKVDANVVPLVQTSKAASEKINGPVYFVFADGAHEYDFVKLDYELWFPKLPNGRLMAFHDCWHRFGVQRFTAVLLFTSTKVRNPKLLDTLTIVEKVEENTLFDRIFNALFVVYRFAIGWIGTIKIDHFGSVK